MCLLLESICIENGEAKLLSYHEQRMNRSRLALLGSKQKIDLVEALCPLLSKYPTALYKCRVLYKNVIEKIEFVPYQRPQINSLKKVYSKDIDYAYKYAAREPLTALFRQKVDCDDILIIKNGVVTDSYFANIIFAKGGKWFTSDQPLLRGAQRQYLIDQDIVKERPIMEEDLSDFDAFKLVNALNHFSTSPAVVMSQIH